MAYYVITKDKKLLRFNDQAINFNRIMPMFPECTVFKDDQENIVAIIPDEMIYSIFRGDTKVFDEMFPESCTAATSPDSLYFWNSQKAHIYSLISSLFRKDTDPPQECCCNNLPKPAAP